MLKLFNTKIKSNDDRERSFLFHSCTDLCSVKYKRKDCARLLLLYNTYIGYYWLADLCTMSKNLYTVGFFLVIIWMIGYFVLALGNYVHLIFVAAILIFVLSERFRKGIVED